jgi:hypothetical protein
MSRFMSGCGLYALILWIALSATLSYADPVVVKPGDVVLPLSGLRIHLPEDPRKGFEWKLAGSYGLEDSGIYDGRDVVDELVKGKLVAGTWILVGYFTAGDPRKVLAGIDLTDAWEGETNLAGLAWAVRGGTFRFDSDLGKVPCICICGRREGGHKDLLIHHYFISDRAIGRDAMLAALPGLVVVNSAVRSWLADRSAPVLPLLRPEVRRRGPAPKMPLHLAKSGLNLTLPNDGYVWISRKPAADDSTDWLDRMAPALPEVELELVRVPGQQCAEILKSITTKRSNEPGPRNLPRNWVAGPTLVVDGHLERTAGLQSGPDALVVGVFVTPEASPQATDFTTLGPILDAIASAATKAR